MDELAVPGAKWIATLAQAPSMLVMMPPLEVHWRVLRCQSV